MATEPKVVEEEARPRTYYVGRLGADSKEDNPEVAALLSGTPNPFPFSDLYTFADQIGPGDIVFLVLGGGKKPVPWRRGLAAVGRVEGERFDVGYRETKGGKPYYRINIRVLAKLDPPIPLRELRTHREFGPKLIRESILGANRVTQAIASLSGPDAACAAVGAMLSEDDSIYDTLRHELPGEILPGRKPTSAEADLTDEELWLRGLLLEYGQVILYGPPGTGKTYTATRIASTFDSSKLTVFHPSYGYEDFVGGLRPQLASTEEGDEVGLKIEEYIGVFQDICDRAEKDPGNHLLIIDEINRGDIARIFGELIYAIELDKRGLEVPLPYLKGRTLSVPPNVFILGTMNSSDRSIALIDVALRRRFAFHELEPNEQLLTGHSLGGVDLGRLLKVLNGRLTKMRDRDHRIGHAYFMTPQEGKPYGDVATFRRAWYGRIIPLIQEYFYTNPLHLSDVLGRGFIRSDEGSGYAVRHHRNPDAFLDALRSILQDEEVLPYDVEEATDVEGGNDDLTSSREIVLPTEGR